MSEWSFPVHVFDRPDQLGQAAARHLVARLMSRSAGERFLIGCPGGRSPMPVYAALAEIAKSEIVDWDAVTFVLMDDYVTRDTEGAHHHVDNAAHFSCRRFGEVEIIGRLNAGLGAYRKLRPDQLWWPDASDPGALEEAIIAAGGVDVFVIATGASDGHVAFNPPGSALDGRTTIVALADTTRSDNLLTFPDFESLDEVPRFGVTVGLGTIRELSGEVMCVAHGASKRQAVQRILTAPQHEPDWPATMLVECPTPSLWVTTDTMPHP